MRKSSLLTSLVLVMALSGGQGVALAQSAKETAKVSNLTILNWTNSSTDWKPIFTSSIKTANQKDLFMSVSLETGLWTSTLVKSKSGTSDTSSATAGVHVRVFLDGVLVEPGEVVFARRTQELTATFGGFFSQCIDANHDGVITSDECLLTEEQVGLILDSMNADSFNFVLPDVGVGQHSITVQARIELDKSVQTGQAAAKAMIGKGSVTVEEVRMIKGTDIFEF